MLVGVPRHQRVKINNNTNNNNNVGLNFLLNF